MPGNTAPVAPEVAGVLFFWRPIGQSLPREKTSFFPGGRRLWRRAHPCAWGGAGKCGFTLYPRSHPQVRVHSAPTVASRNCGFTPHPRWHPQVRVCSVQRALASRVQSVPAVAPV